MKTTIFALCMTALTTMAAAQDIPQSQVPSVVLNAFQSKYSNATDVEWEMEGDLYKVEFEIGRYDHDLWIDKNGVIKRHKEEISKSDLPAAITDKIRTQYSEYRIDDVEKIEIDGKVTYKVELDGKGGDRDVFFAPDGTISDF
jgi:hypothetical protein